MRTQALCRPAWTGHQLQPQIPVLQKPAQASGLCPPAPPTRPSAPTAHPQTTCLGPDSAQHLVQASLEPPSPTWGHCSPGAPPATDGRDLPSPRPTGSGRRALLGML